MKYKIQINGENTEPYRVGNNDIDMFNSEYEFEIEAKQKDLVTLESVLQRAIDDNKSIFNYSIYKII